MSAPSKFGQKGASSPMVSSAYFLLLVHGFEPSHSQTPFLFLFFKFFHRTFLISHNSLLSFLENQISVVKEKKPKLGLFLVFTNFSGASGRWP